MRRYFVIFCLLILLAGPASAEDGTPLPILMYHEVKPQQPGKDCILPAEFESDLRWLRAQGYTCVTMDALVRHVYAGESLPEKPVVLSFDDGYLSNEVYVLPLLRQYGAKIVLSVIGRSAEEFTQYPDDDLRYAHMSWPQLRAAQAEGLVELQNHSYSLHDYTSSRVGCTRGPGEAAADYERRLTLDAEKLQEELYALTGRAPVSYAYPYGLCSPCTEGILCEMGFLATLTCDFGVNRITSDPDCLLGLKRICRYHGANLEKLLGEAHRTLK